MKVQKQLHEQLECQRQLQLSLEAHARYITSLVEQEGLHHKWPQLAHWSQLTGPSGTTSSGAATTPISEGLLAGVPSLSRSIDAKVDGNGSCIKEETQASDASDYLPEVSGKCETTHGRLEKEQEQSSREKHDEGDKVLDEERTVVSSVLVKQEVTAAELEGCRSKNRNEEGEG